MAMNDARLLPTTEFSKCNGNLMPMTKPLLKIDKNKLATLSQPISTILTIWGAHRLPLKYNSSRSKVMASGKGKCPNLACCLWQGPQFP